MTTLEKFAKAQTDLLEASSLYKQYREYQHHKVENEASQQLKFNINKALLLVIDDCQSIMSAFGDEK